MDESGTPHAGTSRPTLATLPPAPAGRTGWPWTEETPAPADADIGRSIWPRVSVVVPSYNQGRFIEETIRSVLLQGYPNLELIVVDGGSRDETVDVLRRYEPWLAYWVSEKDRGQTHAINKGLERVTGEIFSYLNSDDLLTPGALRAVVQGFRAHPEADVVYGRCVYIDEGGAEQFTVQARFDGFRDYLRIWDRLNRREFLTQPEVFCRTRAVVDAGGFREELRSVMDLEMWLRLLSRGHVFRPVDAPVAKFRMYAAQKSSVDPGYELCRVVEEYVRGSGLVSPEEQTALLAELKEAKAHLLVRAGIAATLLDRWGDGVRYCMAAVAAHPRIVGTYPFWAVLAHPAKRFVPRATRGRIQRLFGATGA
jgi:hypothetical protein